MFIHTYIIYVSTKHLSIYLSIYIYIWWARPVGFSHNVNLPKYHSISMHMHTYSHIYICIYTYYRIVATSSNCLIAWTSPPFWLILLQSTPTETHLASRFPKWRRNQWENEIAQTQDVWRSLSQSTPSPSRPRITQMQVRNMIGEYHVPQFKISFRVCPVHHSWV